MRPGTSFHIITFFAFKQDAKIAAVKSDPSLPKVVVLFSDVDPMKPCVTTIPYFRFLQADFSTYSQLIFAFL